MASGRMEFHAQSIMQHANFAYVLPNDVEMAEVRDPRHYDRPTKSLILLHGLTGTDTGWLFGGVAQEMAIQYNLAVFMPTAGNYFYLDRGYPGGNWGTFVGEEFPEYVQKVFGFCAKREDTFIGGLSMGGYGALRERISRPSISRSALKTVYTAPISSSAAFLKRRGQTSAMRKAPAATTGPSGTDISTGVSVGYSAPEKSL